MQLVLFICLLIPISEERVSQTGANNCFVFCFFTLSFETRGLIYKMLRRNHPKFVLRSFRKSA